ncbi:hypothetical protein PHAVU_008G246600, partial [Phaseolus vulgaris]
PSGHCLGDRFGEINMFVKMWTTCTWTERAYEASLFSEIDFGLFLCSLGGRQRRPSSGVKSVRYHSGRARILTLCRTYGPGAISGIQFLFSPLQR